jgi:hypothetical protein
MNKPITELTPKEILIKFFTHFDEEWLACTDNALFCNMVSEEGVCFGLECNRCPLANMSVLRDVVMEEK